MSTQDKTRIASEFLSLCAHGQVRQAYERHVAAHFVHHNAYFASDRNSLLVAMEDSAKTEPNKSFTIRQTIESSDRVAVLSHLKRSAAPLEYAVVHILRFEGDKIVEMWDLGQEIPSDSPNELGMF